MHQAYQCLMYWRLRNFTLGHAVPRSSSTHSLRMLEISNSRVVWVFCCLTLRAPISYSYFSARLRLAQLEASASEIFGPGGGTPATPAVDVKSLHAKIGELTLEEQFLRNGTSFRTPRPAEQDRMLWPGDANSRPLACGIVSRNTTSRGRLIPSRDARRCRTGRRSCAPWQFELVPVV